MNRLIINLFDDSSDLESDGSPYLMTGNHTSCDSYSGCAADCFECDADSGCGSCDCFDCDADSGCGCDPGCQ